MTPRGLMPALLVATCCATVAGFASSQAPQVPEHYKDVASYRAARARLVGEERARRLSSALPLSSLVHSAMGPEEKQRVLAAWEKRWAGFVRRLNEAGDAPARIP
jgi:hypothetical protein